MSCRLPSSSHLDKCNSASVKARKCPRRGFSAHSYSTKLHPHRGLSINATKTTKKLPHGLRELSTKLPYQPPASSQAYRRVSRSSRAVTHYARIFRSCAIDFRFQNLVGGLLYVRRFAPRCLLLAEIFKFPMPPGLQVVGRGSQVLLASGNPLHRLVPRG